MLQAYGMTETCHQATSDPVADRGPDKTGSVGVSHVLEVRVRDTSGADVSPGEVGEVCMRGPSVAGGYLDDPADTAASFVDGWFHTGDLGSLDGDGYLFLHGRMDEVINRGGEKISPSRVDAVLLGDPDVLDALSFGVPDAKYGQIIDAAVVPKPGREIDAARLRERCEQQLAPFEVPSRFYVCADLPRTPKGAGNRRALAAQAAAGTLTSRQPPH